MSCMIYLSQPGRRYGVFQDGTGYAIHQLNRGARYFKGQYAAGRDTLRDAELLADHLDNQRAADELAAGS